MEVIALDAADAAAAEAGGADRLEVVADMDRDGLTPAVETVEAIAAATDLPQRVMLRSGDGFTTTDADLEALQRQAELLRRAGAEGFVFGFLTSSGELDRSATERLARAVGRPWTFHRAIDHAADAVAVWEEVASLPGLDAVLTAGSADGVPVGTDTLTTRRPVDRTLVGGGLKPDHLEGLYQAGLRAFHIGSAARSGWDRPVEAAKVRQWRERLDSLA